MKSGIKGFIEWEFICPVYNGSLSKNKTILLEFHCSQIGPTYGMFILMVHKERFLSV